jgi:MAE_28990/MAE_18760-like HEPN
LLSLRKVRILFHLGLAYEEVDKWSDSLDKLLNYRNNIAHGSFKDGIDSEIYQDIEDATYSMISEIILFVSESISETKYLKQETEVVSLLAI